jgi:hypothetical protein
MTMRYNDKAATGNADTLVAGSTIAGNALDMGDNSRQKVRALSVLVTVDIETTSLTLAGVWQVSNDAVTWVNVTNGTQNAAAVILGTGTGGADASISRVFEAPSAVYGWKKARFTLLTAGATGAAVDTYSLGYNYRVARER